ncbi:MAG: Crp/Fnr family transcriptional regulator [Clostridiales bacterium]|nr:Crp/Fnr family transcriptional regulator [Clostridiales bacterium]
MLTPRYIFADDFKQFYQYFLSQPHIKKTLRKGEYLWATGSPCEKIHYIVSGAAVHYADHENGRRKIISFHASGTVYPGYHLNDYKIELSLTTVALSEMIVLEFTKEQFQKMFESNTALSEQVVNWYSMYVNRFLFETVHQEYNSSLIKICNLLYLLTAAQTSLSKFTIEMTQDELAEMLGLSRVQLTRGLSELRKRNIILTKRNQIKVIDLAALTALCTSEAL